MGKKVMVDLQTILDSLRDAENMNPDYVSQRQVFRECMPILYTLKKNGCSWSQITRVLNETGINLQISTVQSYYSDNLSDFIRGQNN